MRKQTNEERVAEVWAECIRAARRNAGLWLEPVPNEPDTALAFGMASYNGLLKAGYK